MEENNYRRLREQYKDISGTKFIVTSYSNAVRQVRMLAAQHYAETDKAVGFDKYPA